MSTIIPFVLKVSLFSNLYGRQDFSLACSESNALVAALFLAEAGDDDYIAVLQELALLAAALVENHGFAAAPGQFEHGAKAGRILGKITSSELCRSNEYCMTTQYRFHKKPMTSLSVVNSLLLLPFQIWCLTPRDLLASCCSQ